MSGFDQRVMRIPLPVALIRAMDAVIIKGLGGYTTRAEFIVDAIQERVLELTLPEEESAAPPPGAARPLPALPAGATTPGAAGELVLAHASMTALPPPTPAPTVATSDEYARPERSLLFGLHNRDFPSLWALSRLAEITAAGPVPIEDYFTEVCDEAWKFGVLLLGIEKQAGGKRTALFPTNREKKKAAETGFRTFAIGGYHRGPNRVLITTGPLFEWQVVALIPGAGAEPLVGMTPAGQSLLERVVGMTVEEPHPVRAASVFLGHLARHAPADWSGFVEILAAVGSSGATRDEVLARVGKAWPNSTDSEVSTNAAGYIARAREWGLLEPKQIKGCYHLTAFGLEQLNGADR